MFIKKVWICLILFLAVPRVSEAQMTGSPPSKTEPVSSPVSGSGLQNPLRFDDLDEFLRELLDVIVQIGFPIIVLAVIYTGFLFVKARGNEAELKTAKRAFFWVVIGALVVLGAAALSELIQGTVNQIT